jgi:hypothetical protein
MHCPGLVVPVFVPHSVLYGEHTTQGRLSAAVLYVPSAQAVQVFPESVEPNPGKQVPADAPPQPSSLPEHVVHPVLLTVVLKVFGPQAVHVAPGIGAVELPA